MIFDIFHGIYQVLRIELITHKLSPSITSFDTPKYLAAKIPYFKVSASVIRILFDPQVLAPNKIILPV